MKTKQQKIEDWATGLGYPSKAEDVLLISGDEQTWLTASLDRIFAFSTKIRGILTADNVYHPCPNFVDDVEEHELDRLLRLANDGKEFRKEDLIFNQAINNHIKALEKKLEELGK